LNSSNTAQDKVQCGSCSLQDRVKSYRWLVWGTMALAYIVVFFHRMAAGVVKDNLVDAFNISNATFANLGAGSRRGYRHRILAKCTQVFIHPDLCSYGLVNHRDTAAAAHRAHCSWVCLAVDRRHFLYYRSHNLWFKAAESSVRPRFS
jgi:hypothetical protein